MKKHADIDTTYLQWEPVAEYIDWLTKETLSENYGYQELKEVMIKTHSKMQKAVAMPDDIICRRHLAVELAIAVSAISKDPGARGIMATDPIAVTPTNILATCLAFQAERQLHVFHLADI